MPKPSNALARLGQRIRTRRRQLGMSRATFARAANVPKSSIARLERGEGVRVSTYLAVINYLALEPSEPLDDIGERIASLSDVARERVLELIRRLEEGSS